MDITKSKLIFALLVGCSVLGYGLGSGWIRIGTPGATAEKPLAAIQERPLDLLEPRPLVELRPRPSALFDPSLVPVIAPSQVALAPILAAANVGVADPVALTPLLALTNDDVILQLSNGGTAVPITGEIVSDNGPLLVLSVTVNTNDKEPIGTAANEVAIDVKPSRIGLPQFKALSEDTSKRTVAGDKKSMSVGYNIVEVGTYVVEVTKSRGKEAPVTLSKKLEIRSRTNPVPQILSLEEKVSDNVFDPRVLNNPISLKSNEFKLVVTSSEANRKLILVDEQSLTTVDGVGDAAIATANVAVRIAVGIPKEQLLDTLKDLAVYDLWSHDRSGVVTVVIPSDPETPSGASAPRTGPNVEFSEFTPPRRVPDGFNPSDKVETRVVHLYYFRDAHRVAQIVNRDVQSYNFVAVDTRRRQAEKARKDADAATDERRRQEIKAIRKAQESRVAERRLKGAQDKLDEVNRLQSKLARVKAEKVGPTADVAAADTQTKALNDQLTAITSKLTAGTPPTPAEQAQIDLLNQKIKASDATKQAPQHVVDSLTQQENGLSAAITAFDLPARQKDVDDARGKLATAQANETTDTDDMVKDGQLEDRARENQFRQEVAAAATDPDTYAPGKPLSSDPVRQVSISVIGEGVIQLRGPLKGINIIRTMINQIDSPVGQVRIGIHSIQINGEKGDRIEKVATRIQDYVDHSRFLTAQSGQMLRNAVVRVASRKAVLAEQECAALGGAASQAARDAKYQEAFFGRDFINELREIDSEFLMTGNKLLALHSMDTTSLASALFLIALAKNDTRKEILDEFQLNLQTQLPRAESNYYAAGAIGRAKDHFREFKMMSANARFQSFLGFFDAQVEGSDTLNPLQREFIKLAQIFKSRLVTELEYNQRVKERGIIEQRLGDYLGELRKQKRTEDQATAALNLARRKVADQYSQVVVAIAQLNNELNQLDKRSELARMLREPGPLKDIADAGNGLSIDNKAPPETSFPGVTYHLRQGQSSLLFRAQNSQDALKIKSKLETDLARVVSLASDLAQSGNIEFKNIARSASAALEKSVAFPPPKGTDFEPNIQFLIQTSKNLNELRARTTQVKSAIHSLSSLLEELLTLSRSGEVDERTLKIIVHLIGTLNRSQGAIATAPTTAGTPPNQVEAARGRLIDLLQQLLALQNARRDRDDSRQPLDHKKFLDMLIDDVEDKFIDLIEGTRSHTANIDAYIKTIATALDDDFNTQFYYPAFAEIRRASRYYNVSLGKIETTNVLANNRGFAKVEPQATMEFDLPKRDILINEAMNGALAMTKDFGALANDPTFLSMAKLRGGQPTTSLTPGAGGGVNTVRNALPGLSRSDDEQLFSQQGAGQTQFGSAMEALIPDPAVYKFETGTGFEIRPVLQPDGQAVVFHFNYMYTTNIREPVRADEKHLGRVKRHFIDTDVQLGNYELREVSRYQIALKASRTSRGVPLFEDIPGLGILFRPLPSAESSLQENIVLGQSTIFPTLFDLMGLRWAPAVADLDTLRLRNSDFVVRGRNREVQNRVFDYSSAQVDEFLRIPVSERRADLYRTQQTIPDVHPDGYRGPGQNYRESRLREGYDPTKLNPESVYTPEGSRDGPDPMTQPSDDPAMPAPLPEESMRSSSTRPAERGPQRIARRPGVDNRVAPRLPGSPAPDAPRPMIPSPGPIQAPSAPRLDVPVNSTSFRRSTSGGTAVASRSAGVLVDGAVTRTAAANPIANGAISSLPPLPPLPVQATNTRGGTGADLSKKPTAPARRGILSRLSGVKD